MTSHLRTIPGFVRIGSTGKTRGIEGELKLYVDDGYLDDALNTGFLFLELNGNKVPLQIESMREIKDILVKFHNINDPTAASKWSSLEVFLPIDEMTSDEAPEVLSQLEYHNLPGFIIYDVQLGNIGQILEVREFPQQEMAVIQYLDHEVLVPLNPVFIIEIDHEKRTVFMDLPAGLLDM
ncbi:MAG TPA: ribosome maturation factor RimM [Saprospiraceae bacterium]|nr:ribosome maturation factor RimM [Saprospiraceae bacterium]